MTGNIRCTDGTHIRGRRENIIVSIDLISLLLHEGIQDPDVSKRNLWGVLDVRHVNIPVINQPPRRNVNSLILVPPVNYDSPADACIIEALKSVFGRRVRPLLQQLYSPRRLLFLPFPGSMGSFLQGRAGIIAAVATVVSLWPGGRSSSTGESVFL